MFFKPRGDHWLFLLLTFVRCGNASIAIANHMNSTLTHAHPPPVFVLGAMKAGSTALCHSLFKNPRLVVPHALVGEPQHFAKEVHFFDSLSRYKHGLKFYYEHFDPFPASTDNRLIDCTPNYLGNGPAPRLMHDTYKDNPSSVKPKFVAILRPSYDRSISHYSHVMRHLKTDPLTSKITKTWHAAIHDANLTTLIDDAILRWNACTSQARQEGAVEGDLYERCDSSENGYGLVYKSLIDAQLEAWHKFFPQKDFCLLTMSVFHEDQKAAVLRISKFLGLETTSGGWTIDKKKYETVHDHHKNTEALGHHTQALERLREFYAKNVKIFQKLDANNGWLGC